jgi:hypothetical protein
VTYFAVFLDRGREVLDVINVARHIELIAV